MPEHGYASGNIAALAGPVVVKTFELSSLTKGRKRFLTADIVTPDVNGFMYCRWRGYDNGTSMAQSRSYRMPPAQS
jgi:hypothetical protein